jgi:hypothetical protein
MDYLKPGSFAFWSYDLFPFILHGEITSVRTAPLSGDNRVEIKSYGKGYWFEPLFCLPEKEGRELAQTLDSVKEARIEILERLEKSWRAEVRAALPEWVKLPGALAKLDK